jgi:chitodextrinase
VGYLGTSGANGETGAVVILAFQTPGSNPTQTFVPTGSAQTYTVPANTAYVVVKAWGGGEGSSGGGITGTAGDYAAVNYTVSGGQTISVNSGAGGAGGASNPGGSSVVTLPGSTVMTVIGGASGGSSNIAVGSQSPNSSSIIAASGSTTAPNNTDANYPGFNVGNGGTSGGAGGNGAVVIIAYPGTPAITSSLSNTSNQYEQISYTITGSYGPTSFAASSLPAGLSLNTATGVISGSIATAGTYSTTISATNSAGTGTATLVWTVNADTSAPSVPTGLSAATTTGTSSVLSWSASTDNVAVASYEIELNGASWGTTTATTIAIGGLLPGTSYTVAVRASDLAGNQSSWSSPLGITTTSDTTAPTTIAYVKDATETTDTVTLVWSRSSDAQGIAGYNVYRNGTFVGTTTGRSFVDTGLAASTSYSYTIKAFDVAGNLSSASSTLNVTTSASSATDTDGDGVPDSVETLLGTSTTTAGSNDTSNTLQTNVQRPTH